MRGEGGVPSVMSVTVVDLAGLLICWWHCRVSYACRRLMGIAYSERRKGHTLDRCHYMRIWPAYQVDDDAKNCHFPMIFFFLTRFYCWIILRSVRPRVIIRR